MMIHYARGYPKWRAEILDIKLEYRASGSGSASGGEGSSEVERKVERMMRLQDNIELIERCCRESVKRNPAVYQSLLTSVTNKIPLDYINAPIGRKQLSRYRKEFFYLLDNELAKRNIL
jgi:hypothetical protein